MEKTTVTMRANQQSLFAKDARPAQSGRAIVEGDIVIVSPEDSNRHRLNDEEGFAHPYHRLSTVNHPRPEKRTCVVFFPHREKNDNTFNLSLSQLRLKG